MFTFICFYGFVILSLTLREEYKIEAGFEERFETNQEEISEAWRNLRLEGVVICSVH